ncbi:MAG: GHMP kinase [Sulfolobus sp.]
MEVEVEVPLSISGIWYPIYTDNPLTTGSIGLGLALEPKILLNGKISEKPTIIFNNEEINLPNLLILRRLGSLKIEVVSEVPLGFGYGMSGGISLGYAIIAYDLGLTPLREALYIAHESEVETKNGLGDVIVEYYGGGLVYRSKPGAPGIGEVKRIEVNWDKEVCSKPIVKESTSTLLRNNDKALEYINSFLNSPSLEAFFYYAKKFTEELGFKSPYSNSFRKKGLIVKLGNCEKGWIVHKPAKNGILVH